MFAYRFVFAFSSLSAEKSRYRSLLGKSPEHGGPPQTALHVSQQQADGLLASAGLPADGLAVLLPTFNNPPTNTRPPS